MPVIDGFTLTHIIGRGGFSTVYAASQQKMERSVAVKLLNNGFETERQQKTFERECRVLGQVSQHPGIVTVYQPVMAKDGRPGIAMELCATTYRERLRTAGPLAIGDALDLGVRLADALHAVHAVKILHRDIKPHNIFITSYGYPALADFGISSITGERSVTGGGGFSIDYSAPEVLGGQGDPGEGADIYALGATLYHLLSGEVPFPYTGHPDERVRITVGKIITSQPPALHRNDAPPALSRLLRHCMAKAAGERPTTSIELAEELQALQHELGLRPTPLVPLPSRPPEPSGPFGSRHEPADAGASGGDDRSVTIARPGSRPAPAVEALPQVRASPPALGSDRRTRVLVAAGVVAALAVAVIGYAVLSGDDDAGDVVATTTSAVDRSDDTTFEVLDPPIDLSVTRQDDGGVLIEWKSTEESAQYSVVHIGDDNHESETTVVDGTSMVWPDVPVGATACFEVRTVSGGHISASKAGPACVA